MGQGGWAIRIYESGKLKGFLASRNRVNRLKIHALQFADNDAKRIVSEINDDPENQRAGYKAVAAHIWKQQA